ncbi:MAG TPA: hypothetical protein VNS32_02265, partial [Flavisolibacter sp.]|nr:hypothetical protein [Flavisolibacter sp.]
VFELLKSDNFEGNYEITVYQMGWRIGGKGASGREKVPDYSDPLQNNQRILEHGLHAWFGWYDNAFHQFQDCYTHLNWGMEHRFNTWDKAFTPEDNVVIMQSIHNGTQWQGWEINVPAIPGEPGNTVELPSLQEYHQILIQKIHSYFISHPIGKKYAATSTKMHEGLFEKGKELIEHLFERVVEDSASQILKTIENLIASNQKELRKTLHPVRGQIISLIDHFLRWLYNIIGDECDQNFETQKFFTLIDCGLAIVKGLIADNVLYNGLNSINSLDFKEWLKMHGATDVTLNSALVRTVYDSCFAYRKGIKQYPDLEAGVALRICFGIALGSREHWIWKMNAGMGDTIFS